MGLEDKLEGRDDRNGIAVEDKGSESPFLNCPDCCTTHVQSSVKGSSARHFTILGDSSFYVDGTVQSRMFIAGVDGLGSQDRIGHHHDARYGNGSVRWYIRVRDRRWSGRAGRPGRGRCGVGDRGASGGG
jgi:hypothetical protein